MEAAGEEENDGLSNYSAVQEQPQIDLELRLLEALEMYPPSRLQGFHHHFVLHGLMEYLMKSCGKQFTLEELSQLLITFII